MAVLKIPSLQHLSRHWRPEAQGVKRSLVSLALNSPTFNYNALFGAIRDMLVFGQPYDEIVKGIESIKRADLRENLLSVLPLIRDYFDGVVPTYVQSVSRRFYAVGRDLLVPFDPPLIYGVDGRLHFPWFSFWRSNPLAGESLSLFVTIVEEMLLQDPDLETAKFTILDFSAPKTKAKEPKQPRKLTIIDANDIPRVSDERKAKMLAIFAEGFKLAVIELAGSAPLPRDDKRPDADDRDDQPGLFD